MEKYKRTRLPKYFIESVVKDEDNKPIFMGAIHNEWHDFIERKKTEGYSKIGIKAPFRHGKTVQVVEGYSLHEICQNPNIRIKIICNSDDNAKKRVSTIREYINRDEDLRYLHPEIIPARNDRWQAKSFTVQREAKIHDPTVEAYGVLTTGTGSAFDFCVFDDICDLNNTQYETKRETVKSLINGIWLTREEPNALLLSISTAWHVDDAVHMLMRNSEWVFLIQRVSEDFSCIEQIEVNGHNFKSIPELFKKFEIKRIPLWSRWNTERLIKRRNSIGSTSFERGYRQNAFSEESKTFKFYTRAQRNVALPEKVDQHNWYFFGGVDLSGEKRPGNVMVTLGVNPEGHKWFYNCVRFKGAMPEFLSIVEQEYQRFRHSIIHVENNAMQTAIISWLDERNKFLPIRGYFTGSQKMKPDFGLPSLDVMFEQNQFTFPMKEIDTHGPECNCGMCRVNHEFSYHPQLDQEDCVMASWFASEAIRKYYGREDEELYVETPADLGYFEL